MEHFFSIVTSVYNGENYIKRAVESVVNQTEWDYEYVIVDNGSTDGTAQILKGLESTYKDIDIKIISIQENKGISGGRNVGISHAKGKYVCFLDADDYWEVNKLEVVKNFLMYAGDVTVCCHWEYRKRGDDVKIGKYRNINNRDAYRDLLLNGNRLSTSAMTVERLLLDCIGGFDEKLKSGEEDYDCWLRLAENGARFYTLQVPLGTCVIRNDSVSAKYIEHTEAVAELIKEHLKKLDYDKMNKGSIRKKSNKVIANQWFGCGRMLSVAGQRKEGNAIYKKALKISPFCAKAVAGLIFNFLHL